MKGKAAMYDGYHYVKQPCEVLTFKLNKQKKTVIK